ncbi:MAG: sigma-54 dependent transcriptional regulator [Candidatus Aminicenantes bacterium]|jgi:transcriptional regulator with PAS, ATPase and Fis domain
MIVGESQSIREVCRLIDKIQESDVPVFIRGESGTGKELVARAIHDSSRRRHGQFIAVNCSALPESLLESELFGYVRGAFTGAFRDKLGLIEEAHGGTFFLDEIGDLYPHLQAKLLRLLQERETRRVGDNKVRRVDVRFISATHKDIDEEVKRGFFREDLYYRLKILPVELPPLRERKEDIHPLVDFFLKRYCKETGRDLAVFSPQAMEFLIDYEWPGNVRELQNEIQRCLVLCDGERVISARNLSAKLNPQEEKKLVVSYNFSRARAEFEKRFVRQALFRFNYNRVKTAQKMGISRQGLFNLMKRHNITAPSKTKPFSTQSRIQEE